MDDFLSIHDISVYEFSEILDLAEKIKGRPRSFANKLNHKVLAMIFEKPSLRTRMTFEVGMLQLGGEAIYLSPSDIRMGTRESTLDVGKNLERWVDGIMIRTFGHTIAIDLAEATRIQERFVVGGALLGMWAGGVFALRLLRLFRTRRRTIYEIDYDACVACGRCFLSCPRERARLAARKGSQTCATSPMPSAVLIFRATRENP